MKTRVFISPVLVFFLILMVLLQTANGQVSTEETSIQLANTSINHAFDSVFEAEKAGGNITHLLNRLDTAGQLIAQAQNIYQAGNTVGVTSKANSAKQIADQVNTDAITLRDASLTLTRNNFWFIVTFSIGGAVVFGLLMLIIWQRFKRSYTKKLLSLKPEVTDNAT